MRSVATLALLLLLTGQPGWAQEWTEPTRRTWKEKVKQVTLFPFRYIRCLVTDFGIRESIWIAWDLDHICFH